MSATESSILLPYIVIACGHRAIEVSRMLRGTGEDRTMRRHRSLKRLLVVTLLAGGLALAGPANAQAAPLDGPQAAWKWLTRIWEQGIAAVWERPAAGRLSSQKPTQQKQGVCIDPNGSGCSPNSVRPAAGLTCRALSEQGVCIDPNG